ncbi:MAG: ATP-binding protein [Acidimicrobiia bacterium]|nr:ATP-binding protein [Acidimicrobiia bacterium]
MLTNGRSMRLSIAARAEDVAMARRAVRSFLIQHGVSMTVAEDVQMIASELVTNAVIHGRPGPIAVELELDAEVRLRVTNDGPAAAVPSVAEWQVAASSARSGRGLGIVRRLSDDCEVGGDGGRTTITVRRALPDAGGVS